MKRRKTLHELIKFRLEGYKKELDCDLARGFQNYDPGTAEHEIYLLDLGRYVETILADINLNRGGMFSFLLLRYHYKDVEQYNEEVKTGYLTNDEWNALKSYDYYYQMEDSAL